MRNQFPGFPGHGVVRTMLFMVDISLIEISTIHLD